MCKVYKFIYLYWVRIPDESPARTPENTAFSGVLKFLSTHFSTHFDFWMYKRLLVSRYHRLNLCAIAHDVRMHILVYRNHAGHELVVRVL